MRRGLNSPSASIKKGKSDFSQFVAIVVAAIVGYLFFDPNPGGGIDVDLIIRTMIVGVITIIVLLFLTYYLQKFVAKTLGGSIKYEFWPWGIFASVVVGILSIGAIVFYMPGIFWLRKNVVGAGRRLPDTSRVETASIAGVGASLGLLFAIIFIDTTVVSVAAATYAVWNLLPIPKTNGFHFFNWHPLHGGFTAILGLVLLFTYVTSQLWPFLVIITIIFLAYHWFYVYVLARRTGY